MTKDKRLGRGLEALLSRVAKNVESASQSAESAMQPYPAEATSPSPLGGAVEKPDEGSPNRQAQAAVPTDGRGSPSVAPVQARPEIGTATAAAEVLPIEVDVRQIDGNPFQPRRHFDEKEMRSLSESLHAHGLLQPIVVRRVNDRYQVVAGERRLRAAVSAGWTRVPVQLVEADDRQAAELAIVENLQRKDLNALEKAASFHRYLEHFGCTQEELAARLKLDRSTIANLIRLLELPEPVQEAVRRGGITPGHARALLPLGDEDEQVQFCRRIQDEGLSVRQTEQLVQEKIEQADAVPLGVIGRDGKPSRAPRIRSEHLASLEQDFRAALGTKVKITHSGRGRGKLVIHFTSHEEFERLRRHICGAPGLDARRQVG